MPTSHPATMVGRYLLLSKVGEGGMGVVHLAEDPTGHQVAIKLLRPHVVSDEHGRARMAREVTSLRRVRSPRVAEVYDADPWGETPYIVTRFVPGPSLYDRVESAGPMTGADIDTLAGGLAEALVAVHDADVLHRDVKPSNVLLEGSNPVLIDFGLAQLSDDSRITYSGWLLGTPGYLAPEILFGDEPSQQADVHSWAATVVYAATGRGPYGKGPAVAVMDRVRRGEHDLTGVPDSLYWIVRQALSPDLRDRPSARQLADWLSGGLVGGGMSRDRATAQTSVTASAPPTRVAVSVVRPEVAAPARAVPAQQPAYPAANWRPAPAPTAVPEPWPTSRQRPGLAVRILFWFEVACLVAAGSVTAPVLTGLALCIAAWLMRTLAVRANRLLSWRQRRGYRRGDSFLATLSTPWFAVVALPGAAVNAALALVDAALVVVIATLTAPPRALVLVLALAGVVASVFIYWGPFSREIRAGGASVTSVVLRPGTTALVMVLAVFVAVVAVLATRQVVGPTYAPLPAPPWHQSLRNALP